MSGRKLGTVCSAVLELELVLLHRDIKVIIKLDCVFKFRKLRTRRVALDRNEKVEFRLVLP